MHRVSRDFHAQQHARSAAPTRHTCHGVRCNTLRKQGTLRKVLTTMQCLPPSPCTLRYSAELLSSWPRSTVPVTIPMRTRSPLNSFCCSCRGPSSCWNSHRLRGREPNTLFLLCGDIGAAIGGALPAKLGGKGASGLTLGLWPLMWCQTLLESAGVAEPCRAARALLLLLLTPLTVLSMRSAKSVCCCCCWCWFEPCPFSWL